MDHNANQLLSEVDDSLSRSLFNVEPALSKSFRTSIVSLIPLVEDADLKYLPESFCIMFDGWTDATTHYEATFTTYTIKGEHFETMLPWAPLLEEDGFSALQ